MNTSTIPVQSTQPAPQGTPSLASRALRGFFAVPAGRVDVPQFAHRLARLILGLVLYGIGIAGIVRGAIGAAPWDVLSQGLSRVTGLSFGTLTVIISGVVLLCWIPLRQLPQFGTIANSLLVGPAADLGLHLIPADLELWARIPVFAGGLLVIAIATGIYLSPNFGPGPRDGLMTGLHRRLGPDSCHFGAVGVGSPRSSAGFRGSWCACGALTGGF